MTIFRIVGRDIVAKNPIVAIGISRFARDFGKS